MATSQIEALVGNMGVLWIDTARASLEIGTGDAGIRYEAKSTTENGNGISVEHVDPGAAGPLSVSIAGKKITVTLASDGGAVTSTAAEVRAEVLAAIAQAEGMDYAKYVRPTLLGDGSGVAVAQAETNLSGGEVTDYQIMALQRGLSDESAREIIDASHKASDHAKSGYGRMSGTASMDGLVPDPDIGNVETHRALKDAQLVKDLVMVEIRQTGVAGTVIREAAEALVGTISREMPDNDVSSFSVEFTFQGPLTEVA